MKRLFGLVLACGMLFAGIFCAPAGADDTVKVWTQNLYIGADLTPVIEAIPRKSSIDAANGVLEKWRLISFRSVPSVWQRRLPYTRQI